MFCVFDCFAPITKMPIACAAGEPEGTLEPVYEHHRAGSNSAPGEVIDLRPSRMYDPAPGTRRLSTQDIEDKQRRAPVFWAHVMGMLKYEETSGPSPEEEEGEEEEPGADVPKHSFMNDVVLPARRAKGDELE